jgi:integrative and conjugative element protein (TIGR02256 family)
MTDAWSSGQRLALDQLERISAVDENVVIIGKPEAAGHGWCSVAVTMDFAEAAAAGDVIGPQETVTLGIPPDFPFSMPQASVGHDRFARYPHVLWQRYICLYLSESDWDPGDGMFGFLSRLADWFVRVASATLEEVGQPLHPPLARPSAEAGSIVVPEDFPDLDPRGEWDGMAVVSMTSEDRADVVTWLPWNNIKAETKSDFLFTRYMLEAWSWRRNKPTLLAPVIVLPEPLSFEFPSKVGELFTALGRAGVTRGRFTSLLRVATRLNHRVARAEHGTPLYLFIGAPMRGIAGDFPRQTHLAVWRLKAEVALLMLLSFLEDHTKTDNPDEPLDAGDALWTTQPVSWTIVHEQRPQIITRRDSGKPAEWLRGRSVLVLGCGALGGRIAEHCLRGGVAHLIIADKGVVNPGILVRQPYQDDDVGRAKSRALAARLSAIRPDAAVSPITGDILRFLDSGAMPPDVDLIVDAAANRSVSARIEMLRWQSEKSWPPILTVGVGHDCQRGIASIAIPEATGASVDIFHNLALAAQGSQHLTDVIEDFFPDPGQRKPFQPEPGCSDATFQGSDSEAAALAAQMFSWGLHVLRDRAQGKYVAPKSIYVARLPAAAGSAPGQEFLEWQNDITIDDRRNGYQIRFWPAALESIRAEALSTDRLEGYLVETGGILLGRIDDACRVIWVTAAEGPPPDSKRGQHYFRHGLEGVAELISTRVVFSGGREGFIGMWHTHPAMSPEPSDTDLTAMSELLVPGPGAPSRGVLAVFGGRPGPWKSWLNGEGSPNVYARLYKTAEPRPPRELSRPPAADD